MKSLKNVILESNNKKKFLASLGHVLVDIKRFGFDYDFINDPEIDILNCTHNQLENVLNSSDGTFTIEFTAEDYGTFKAEIELSTDKGVKVNLNQSDFGEGSYDIWKRIVKEVCSHVHLGDIEYTEWGEELLNELEDKIK